VSLRIGYQVNFHCMLGVRKAESGDVAWSPKKRWKHEHRPWVDARQSIGNIVIAGTDAASNAMTESAIEEAHRAVHELM